MNKCGTLVLNLDILACDSIRRNKKSKHQLEFKVFLICNFCLEVGSSACIHKKLQIKDGYG